MKTIIVPVNFSASSDSAARYAADMALAIHADVQLIHFVQVPVSTTEFPMNAYIFDELQKSGQEGLRQLREELVARTGGNVYMYTTLEVDSLQHGLAEFCTKKSPFLVVLGGVGTAMERALAGSSLAGVLRHLPYPLLVVPENVVFHSIKKIVLACDLEDIAAGVAENLPFLKKLGDTFGSSFEVVNISTTHKKVHTKVEEGIREYLDGHPADLLLVFPKKHDLLEFHTSYSKKIVFHSIMPVMSIHI